MRRAALYIALVFLPAVLAVTPRAWAGRGPQYQYGEAWWLEYSADKATTLLLHFGPPQVSPRQRLAESVKEKIHEETLGVDLDDLEAADPDLGLGEIPAAGGPDAFKLPPVAEAAAPAGTILDYSDRRLQLKLPDGMATTAEGRFGAGLACGEGGPLRAKVGNVQFVECWFKVERLPAAPACIFSVAGDESRVLLHPDGRLELKLKHPHGFPGRDPNAKEAPTPEAIALIEARPADIISPDPVAPGQWHHVAVYNQPHPTPGGGEPWDARLKVNGTDVAWYLSERYNSYAFLGGREAELALGANSSGGEPFTGTLDEVRAASRVRELYERPGLPWRDAAAARPLQFDRPFFREDGTRFHASLDKGTALDFSRAGEAAIAIDLKGLGTEGLSVDGVRGKGWVVDPGIGLPRIPLPGMSAQKGSLEFWLRPVNWDDVTGYWHHSPPRDLNLGVARLVGRDPDSGKPTVFMTVSLPRAYNLERQRIPLDPGHWTHLVVVWAGDDAGGAALFINGKRSGGLWRAEAALRQRLEPLYVEFGVTQEVSGADGAPPRIEIDEVVGYGWPLMDDEVEQARRRWMGELKPIKLYRESISYKYALHKLEFGLTPLLPEAVRPATLVLSMGAAAESGKPVLGPFTVALEDDGFHVVLSEGRPLAPGAYRLAFQVKDTEGRAVLDETVPWEYREEPWRECAAGILQEAPPPWTPIEVNGREIATRMSRYLLADNGLPAQVSAAGGDLLAAACELREDGAAMAGQLRAVSPSRNVEADWQASFTGATCNVSLDCRIEFDGMVRFELRVAPTRQPVAPLSLVIPVRAERARRFLYHAMGDRGVRTGTVGDADGVLLESRAPHPPYAVWQAYTRERQKRPQLAWADYWAPIRAKTEAYGFFGHLDVNDMDRGLFWFCDNAAGWVQSKTRSAIELVREGDRVLVKLNFVPEPADYTAGTPIVFGLLPHPARPLPEKYRLFEKTPPAGGGPPLIIYDAFRPWPIDPKAGDMKVFPAADPRRPEAGPSWEYAESCIPYMKGALPGAIRTLYLSKAWFSCRAGAYDGWEWRSGESGAVSLTPSFVNYLCWEMNEWIGRGIWDAIYLDECYEHPARNLEAGHSVRLPDGGEQPGVTNFAFRELMKRWRGLFHAHGRAPILIAHHTHSWQYAGLVFCDSTLDGENSPIVSLQSRDWIDSTSKERFEGLQNARLWGVATFYMPFVSEGGFENKTRSQFPRWQWRMARQAQSQFAHYETSTVYEGQGGEVYKAFWREALAWGAGDLAATFHPYWEANSGVTVEDGNGGDTLVSFYRMPGKLLLVASNRRREPITARVRLDRARLGLPAELRVAQADPAFDPPPGDDYLGAADTRKETAELFEQADDLLTGEEAESVAAEDLLVGEAGREAEQAAALEPRLEGDTLILPIRPRDYRVVRIE